MSSYPCRLIFTGTGSVQNSTNLKYRSKTKSYMGAGFICVRVCKLDVDRMHALHAHCNKQALAGETRGHAAGVYPVVSCRHAQVTRDELWQAVLESLTHKQPSVSWSFMNNASDF